MQQISNNDVSVINSKVYVTNHEQARERQRQTQTDRQTHRDREKDRQREKLM